MNITEEDRLQYNLIEDKEKSRIIGRTEDVLNYLNDMIEYNLNKTDDELSIENIKDVIKYINEDMNKNIDEDTLIAIFDNPMCGLDWQLIDYKYNIMYCF